MPDLIKKMDALQLVLGLTDDQAEALSDYIDSAIYVASRDLEDRINRAGIYDPDY